MALMNFAEFSKKVLEAADGKLTPKEMGTLKRLFSRVKKRNLVLAAGLLSALKAGGASKGDTQNLSSILENANQRIFEGKKPFTREEEKELASIFERAHFPQPAQARFKHNIQSDEDDLLVSQIAESIHRDTRKQFGFVPERSAQARKEQEKPQKRRG